MELHRSRIESIGVRVPEQRVSSEEIVAACGDEVQFNLERLTGIIERPIAGEGEDSHTLAVDAARDCLARSCHDAADLDIVISCSITRYRGRDVYTFEPAVSLHVKAAIGATRAIHFDVSNACAGMLTGLAILDDFIRRGVARRGMVVSGEHITSLAENAIREIDTLPHPQIASLTLGDSGAAMILERAENGSPGISACEFATFGDHSDLCIGKPCQNGPGAVMLTDPVALHSAAIDAFCPTLGRALERSGLELGDVAMAIPHQSTERAIRTGIARAEKEFGSTPGHTLVNLAHLGNTSSTTHALALHQCLEEGRLAPGDAVALLCFASGLVVGTVIFTMDELARRNALAG